MLFMRRSTYQLTSQLKAAGGGAGNECGAAAAAVAGVEVTPEEIINLRPLEQRLVKRGG